MPQLLHAVMPVAIGRGLAVISLTLMISALALAHGTLTRTQPAANSTVATPPSEIRLWFNESIEHRFSRVTVHRATKDAATGELSPQDRVDEGLTEGPRVTRELTVKLPASLTPGLYLVQWKVLSVDSHRTTGKFTLTYNPKPATGRAQKAKP